MTAACYAYAVTRPFDVDGIRHIHGVDDTPLDLLRHRDLVAVTSAMPHHAAAQSAIRARLESLEPLAAMARAHHAVVEAVAAHTVVIPLRMATIHHHQRRVLDLLRHHYTDFDATLERLAGRVEVGVKMYADTAQPPTPATDAGSGSASPGRDYLRARRDDRARREQLSRAGGAAADRLDTALAGAAVQRVLHRPQAADNILNASYLVAKCNLPAFHTLARRLGTDAAGARLEVTGPWPPYSFAGLGLGDRP